MDEIKLKGIVANKVGDIIKGTAYVDPYCENFPDDFDNLILVCKRVSFENIKDLTNFKAIITSYGGVLSHAAMLLRELNVPCIVAVEKADTIIKNSDKLILDFNKGVIKIRR